MRQKNLDSRLHEYPDAKKMTEIRWYPVVSVLVWWGGLLWSWVDVVFLTVSLITLYDTQWHSTVQQVASSLYSGVKSVSFLLLSDRYHEEGSHIELFFSSNQRWPPGYYHQQIYREGGRSIPSILWVLVDGIPQNLQQTFSSELCVVTWKICIF